MPSVDIRRKLKTNSSTNAKLLLPLSETDV
jgi:hypothetical protein